mmetsp:Transcript_130149/g.278118  ORF Transcript_130149/g.278118 Transcript_130149/m.278118 type:complete len:253 (+) Transcript_130149:126-884(+)
MRTFSNEEHNPCPAIRLWAPNTSFWRPECVRMCLCFGRVPFEDRRVSYKELYSSGMVVFGTYPALEVNGRSINQTHAMAAFAGKLSGFYPSDPWQAAKVDEVFAALTDATFCITKTQDMKNMESKSRLRAEMMCPGGRLHCLLSGLQSLLVQNGRIGLFAGAAVTVADLAVWRAIIWLCSGIVVGVDPEHLARSFPELVRLYRRIEALPNVQEWKLKHPDFYATPEARWKDWRPYPPASFLTEPTNPHLCGG